MTDTTKLAANMPYVSFEISPIKYDGEKVAERQPMVVCSIMESEQWAAYGRTPDGLATWLADGTQQEVLKFITDVVPDASIVLKTDIDSHPITPVRGKPTFGVMPCRIGDNGVLIPLSNAIDVEAWGLLAFRNTGSYGLTYVELGRFTNKAIADYALSAIMYQP